MSTSEQLLLGDRQVGTMTFGDQVDERAAAQMVGVARDAGISTFDTSNNYAGGRSEEILGRIVRSFRDDVIVATKVGSPVGQGNAAIVGLTATAIRQAVEQSLRRLATDYIDVCYLHRPDHNTPIEESLAAMADLVRAGKVRTLAQSNYAAWQVTEMHCLAERKGWPRVGVAQIMYNLLARRVETEYAACAQRLGLVNVVYNPLAGGLLTGKHESSDPGAHGKRFTRELYRERYWNDTQFAAIEALKEVAHRAGLSLVELALRWARDRSLTDSIVLGASSVAQLQANLDALAGPKLDAETARECEAVTDGLLGAAPAYNR